MNLNELQDDLMSQAKMNFSTLTDKEKLALARSQDTDPTVLDELSKDKNWVVRNEICFNINVLDKTLVKLTKDADSMVKKAAIAVLAKWQKK